MKASVKRTISLLLSILFIILALVIYAFLVRPVYDEILVLRGTFRGKQKLFSEQEAAIQKVNDLVQRYQGTARLQDVINMSLPVSENLSLVFGQLYAIARKNNVNIEVFGVQPLAIRPSRDKSLVKGLGTLRLSLRLTGSYDSLKDFVGDLETNIRVMDVSSLKIDQTAVSNVLVYNLIIDTYYQPK